MKAKSFTLALTFVIASMLISCSSITQSQGQKNAIEYVRGIATTNPLYSSDVVEDITAIENDSLAGTTSLNFYSIEYNKALTQYYKNEISKDSARKVIDRNADEITKIQTSWQYNGLVDDKDWKAKNLSLYRKVYKVTIKWKSGKTQDVRVLMDNDGITPRATERDVEIELRKATEDILRAYAGLSW